MASVHRSLITTQHLFRRPSTVICSSSLRKEQGKKLLSTKSMDVRPMMEVVKGAVFGILQAAGGCPTSLRPGRRSMVRFIQCTGSVGIEAISGGCFEVHFWEMDPWVVSDVLRPNLEWTGFLDNSVIHTAHVETYLKRTKGDSFEYISVTPPYMLVDYEILMKQISESSVIGDDSLLGAIPPTASIGFSMSKGATRKHKGLVLNYVSKRRVPNGPDPIHNRKVTNTRQPPERV